jgi:hypothetical protein
MSFLFEQPTPSLSSFRGSITVLIPGDKATRPELCLQAVGTPKPGPRNAGQGTVLHLGLQGHCLGSPIHRQLHERGVVCAAHPGSRLEVSLGLLRAVCNSWAPRSIWPLV